MSAPVQTSASHIRLAADPRNLFYTTQNTSFRSGMELSWKVFWMEWNFLSKTESDFIRWLEHSNKKQQQQFCEWNGMFLSFRGRRGQEHQVRQTSIYSFQREESGQLRFLKGCVPSLWQGPTTASANRAGSLHHMRHWLWHNNCVPDSKWWAAWQRQENKITCRWVKAKRCAGLIATQAVKAGA